MLDREKNILIIGKNGLIGSLLFNQLSHNGFNVHTISVHVTKNDKKELAIIDDFIVNHRIGIVINCAAMIGMRECYEAPRLAEVVNAWLPFEIAKISENHAAHMIHLSTEAVFPSHPSFGVYDVSDRPGPETIYGKTKFAGEQSVLRVGEHTVIRLPRVFDCNKQIILALFERLSANGAIEVANDLYSTPIFSSSAVNGIVHIVNKVIDNDRQGFGLVHITGNRRLSLFELFCMLVDSKSRKKITPVSSSFFTSNQVEPAFLNGGLKSCAENTHDIERGIKEFRRRQQDFAI